MADFKFEKQHKGYVAGIDEAGRGPLAGPVVAAALIFKKTSELKKDFFDINDSKKLSVKKREYYFSLLKSSPEIIDYGVGIASVEEIDKYNILQATYLAMHRATSHLKLTPQHILVDGNKSPKFICQSTPIVKGDQLSLSIAAASILAKTTRDHLMQDLSTEYPYYKWEKNMGYGTAEHLKAINEYGISPYHRLSFAPVKNMDKSSTIIYKQKSFI